MPYRPISTRPAGAPPMETSKYTVCVIFGPFLDFFASAAPATRHATAITRRSLVRRDDVRAMTGEGGKTGERKRREASGGTSARADLRRRDPWQAGCCSRYSHQVWRADPRNRNSRAPPASSAPRNEQRVSSARSARMARPPALRVFWPEPRLPRLEAGSGYLSEDDAAPPREVLVGWWRETSAGADAVVAGAVPSTSDASLDDILLAVVDASAGSHPGAIPLGPLRVLGEVVPPATPPRARGGPPSDAARVASPRRTPRRKARDRAPSAAAAAAAAPADDVELWIAVTEPSTEPSRTPRRSHRAAFPEFREVRWRGDDLLKRSGGAIASSRSRTRSRTLAPARSPPPPRRRKKKKKTPPPDPDPDSDPNSSPPSLAWAESATRASRLSAPRGGGDVARRGEASAERRLPARVARFVRDAAARAAALLEVRCVPGLRSRHAWRLAPEDPPRWMFRTRRLLLRRRE